MKRNFRVTHTAPDGQTVFHDRKTEALVAIIRERVRYPIRRVLVVGCGSGKEAAILAAGLGATAVGIDLQDVFDPLAAIAADLRRGDATCLEFPDCSFDFVFSYHVLEHIPDYTRALEEMHRVLAEGGAYCIGTPNRRRVVGYLGSPDATWRDRFAWNLADWKARLRGRFRNEFGAHAGFTSAELNAALANVFGTAEEVTLPYYLRVYSNQAAALRVLSDSGAGDFLFPSIYFFGRKLSGVL